MDGFTDQVSTLLGTCIMIFLLALVSVAISALKKWGAAQSNTLVRMAVDTVVQAAEQVFAQPQAGKDKYQYVVDELAKRGIKADRDDIEAAVRRLTIVQAPRT